MFDVAGSGSLSDLLSYREILGAVATTADGSVVDAAGLSAEDAILVVSLAGTVLAAADQTAHHLGTVGSDAITMTAGDGMLHLRQRHGITLIVVTERCLADPVATVIETAIEAIAASRRGGDATGATSA